MKPGDILGPWEFPVSRAALVRYAGASLDFNPIHWSDHHAEQVGLPGVIAHGMFTMGVAIQGLVDLLGDPGAVLDYAVRFSEPVVVPPTGITTLTVTGKVSKLDQDVATVLLTVTHQGVKVLSKAVAKVRTANS